MPMPSETLDDLRRERAEYVSCSTDQDLTGNRMLSAVARRALDIAITDVDRRIAERVKFLKLDAGVDMWGPDGLAKHDRCVAELLKHKEASK